MELTKEEKMEMYSEALDYFKNNDDGGVGICVEIDNYLYKAKNELFWTWDNDSNSIRHYFPEFIKHKPKYKSVHSYWWDDNDTQIRIKVLEEIIKELKKQ